MDARWGCLVAISVMREVSRPAAVGEEPLAGLAFFLRKLRDTDAGQHSTSDQMRELPAGPSGCDAAPAEPVAPLCRAAFFLNERFCSSLIRLHSVMIPVVNGRRPHKPWLHRAGRGRTSSPVSGPWLFVHSEQRGRSTCLPRPRVYLRRGVSCRLSRCVRRGLASLRRSTERPCAEMAVLRPEAARCRSEWS